MGSDTGGQTAARILGALRAVMGRVAEPTVVLRTILDIAVAESGADRGVFVEVPPDGDLAYRVLHRFDPRDLEGDRGRFSRGILDRAVAAGRPVRVADACRDGDTAAFASVVEFKMVSVLCVPIVVDGRVAALVHLESDEPGHFTADHERLLDSLLGLAGPALGALQAGQDVLRRAAEASAAARAARDEVEESRRFLARNWSFGRFVGRTPVVRELEERVRRACAMEFPVLIEGETGTGKSILARVLHHGGPRAAAAFVTVFCPSLERGTVEADLFGHRKGAFTSADADRQGKIHAADGGTLFLDEIGELPLEIQPKLLRLLQEKTFERVGDAVERRADVRVIAATNRDLDSEVRAGRFRRDLYERLNYVPLRVPPLRERRDDIPLLLRHCLDQHDDGRWIEISAEAERYLIDLDFAWPGNVRHLDQLAVRLVLDAPRGPVGPDTLARALGRDRGAPPDGVPGSDPAPDLDRGLPALLAATERAWLEEAIRRHPELTRAELAKKLKISETTLFKKLRQHGITG